MSVASKAERMVAMKADSKAAMKVSMSVVAKAERMVAMKAD